MKRTFLHTSLCVISLIFLSCTGEAVSNSTAIAPLIIPRAGTGIILQSGRERQLVTTQTIAEEEFRIPIPENAIPLRLLNENLDYDQSEEQIVAYKARDAQSGDNKIKLLVVRLDPIYSNVVSAWEGSTLASEARSFSMFTEDVVGDFSKEIIAVGIDEDGNQTLDIFHPIIDGQSEKIAFYSILSLKSSIGLELQRVEQGEAYQKKSPRASVFLYISTNSQKNHHRILFARDMTGLGQQIATLPPMFSEYRHLNAQRNN